MVSGKDGHRDGGGNALYAGHSAGAAKHNADVAGHNAGAAGHGGGLDAGGAGYEVGAVRHGAGSTTGHKAALFKFFINRRGPGDKNKNNEK